MARIHWRHGQLLTPEHLVFQQESVYKENTHLSLEMLSLEDGLIDLEINEIQLRLGVVELSRLTLILPCKTLISVTQNALISSYRIDHSKTKEVSELYEIYLNIDHQPHIELLATKDKEVEVEFFHVKLTNAFCPQAKYSIKIFDLIYNDSLKQWEISDTFMPRLSKLPYLYGKAIFRSLGNLINQLRSKVLSEVEQFNRIFKYQSLLLKLSEYEFWLQHIHARKVSVCFYEILKVIVGLHAIAYLYQGKTVPISSLGANNQSNVKNLLRVLQEYIASLDKIEYGVVHLDYSNGLYSTKILSEEVVRCRECFVIIENPYPLAVGYDLEKIKVFSPSRIKEILVQAILGVELTQLDSAESLKLFPDARIALSLNLASKEWKHIVKDKKLCLYAPKRFDDMTKIYLAYE